MRLPGIEPGSSGWKPDILTTIPKARCKTRKVFKKNFSGGNEIKYVKCNY